MRHFYSLFFLLISFFSTAQEKSTFEKCKSDHCKAVIALQNARFFIEKDSLKLSQKWLNISKDYNIGQDKENISLYIHSLQSEIFYYMGLFQFGQQEAKKTISKASKLRDSTMIGDGYFFDGINNFELGNLKKAEKSLQTARQIFPRQRNNKKRFQTIEIDHIYNNIARLKLVRHQLDSAYFYNEKAYDIALENYDERVIVNSEQLFGEIFTLQKDKKMADLFFEKSLANAIRFQQYDVALMIYGQMMENNTQNPALCQKYFKEALLKNHVWKVNPFYQQIFNKSALIALRKIGATKEVIEVQDAIINLEKEQRVQNNALIQNISNQYIRNENRLLTMEVEKLKRQRSTFLLELFSAILLIIVLALAILMFRRKNRLQKNLLAQKNEISKDLHDDIGSALGSILIHADILQKNTVTEFQQQLLAGKIHHTGLEISQKLNTFIWTLSGQHNQVQSFCEYVNVYGNKLFEDLPVKFHFSKSEEVDGHAFLNGRVRKNLFFCIKELLNNTIKYAGAKNVSILVEMPQRKKLRITVSDDGKGLLKENVFGNGLTNVKMRMESIAGEVSFESKNGFSAVLYVLL